MHENPFPLWMSFMLLNAEQRCNEAKQFSIMIKAAKIHVVFVSHHTTQTTPLSLLRTSQLPISYSSQATAPRARQMHNRPLWAQQESSRKRLQQSVKTTMRNLCCCRATKNINKRPRYRWNIIHDDPVQTRDRNQ